MSLPPTPPSTAPVRGTGVRGRLMRGVSFRGRGMRPPGGSQGAPAPPAMPSAPAPPAPPSPPAGGSRDPPDPNPGARAGDKRTASSPAPRDVEASKRAREGPAVPVQKLTLKKPRSHHMRKEEIEKDEISTKTALETHIRALWMLPLQTKVPPKPSEAQITVFESRFSDEMAVATSVRDTLRDNAVQIDGVRKKVSKFRNDLLRESISIIAGNIR
ncbi:hypothetical protein M413DRAFT_29987 [Hebeloma cylindrosporum]|uniref:Uncharacterized protein n=1 Tax=Hebeloma cylindrosporum TaxID=76867 RepID=A0A0C2YCM3_HEBCY|nr:hypothetical protein M413DRAFT_29987 [Hebeloma cylindrosporum h7]